ncbi:lipopolysaccharide transport periplasmic protein LptA [soil metagenome]
MKQFVFPLLFIFNLAIVNSALAEKADSEKPTKVDADQMTYDDVKQVNTFTGNVVLTRGSLIMKASKVVVTQDPSGYQFATLTAAPGALASFRQKRDGGPNLWIEGQAERIVYDGKAELVRLYSKAQMKRLEGDKPTDEVTGELITYDSRAEFFTVNNTVSGDKPGGGRISMVIQPRTDSKADAKADPKSETKAAPKAEAKGK